MKRVALLLIASFVSAVAALPAAEVPARQTASKRNYRNSKKVRRAKLAKKKAKRRAPRRNTVN